MEFNQPSEILVTDKTVAEEKRLTDIRNQVTLLEGESVRLRDLIQSEKYEINELVKQKAELESQLPVLEERVSILKNVIENLAAEEIGMKDYKAKVTGECEALIKHAEVIMQNTVADREVFEKERASFQVEKEELANRVVMVGVQETVLAEKAAKLRELIL